MVSHEPDQMALAQGACGPPPQRTLRRPGQRRDGRTAAADVARPTRRRLERVQPIRLTRMPLESRLSGSGNGNGPALKPIGRIAPGPFRHPGGRARGEHRPRCGRLGTSVARPSCSPRQAWTRTRWWTGRAALQTPAPGSITASASGEIRSPSMFSAPLAATLL